MTRLAGSGVFNEGCIWTVQLSGPPVTEFDTLGLYNGNSENKEEYVFPQAIMNSQK